MDNSSVTPDMPTGSGGAGMTARGAMQVVGGMVPLVGGFLAAMAGAWSEKEPAALPRRGGLTKTRVNSPRHQLEGTKAPL